MKCAKNRTTCARSVVQCYASGEVRCGIVVSVVISILSFLSQFYFFHIVVLILLVAMLKLFISLLSRGHFSQMFSQYSHGILGVVFTHTVDYSRPPSAVNFLTVIKQVISENHASNKCPNHFCIRFP